MIYIELLVFFGLYHCIKDGEVVKAGLVKRRVLREVFQIDAVIGRDPGTNKPMCVTYNLLRGENEHEETINPVYATADAYD